MSWTQKRQNQQDIRAYFLIDKSFEDFWDNLKFFFGEDPSSNLLYLCCLLPYISHPPPVHTLYKSLKFFFFFKEMQNHRPGIFDLQCIEDMV